LGVASIPIENKYSQGDHCVSPLGNIYFLWSSGICPKNTWKACSIVLVVNFI